MLALSHPLCNHPVVVTVLSLRGFSLSAASLLLLYLVGKYWPSKTGPRRPPGPRPLPLVGSKCRLDRHMKTSLIPLHLFTTIDIFDMPTDCLGPGLSKLGEQYGPLTWMVIPGRNILLLNDYKAMKELLDKRGANNIDRPRLVMFGELSGEWGHQLPPIWQLICHQHRIRFRHSRTIW